MTSTRRGLLVGLATSAGAVHLSRPVDAAAAAATPSDAGQRVDVQQYGAVGDGVHDDAAAISSAIAAVSTRGTATGPGGPSSSGGTVYFPPGVYAIGSPLSVGPAIQLVGESASATQVRYVGNSTTVMIAVGAPTTISTYGGVRSMTVDADARADIGVLLYGPQEGSTVADARVSGARQIAVDVRSSGVVGGSNKFTVERSWLWTTGDSGIAGLRLDAQSGPVSIRDTTIIGTNRNAPPADGTAGIMATRSALVAENVNVEHYDAFAWLDQSHAEVHIATSFFTRHGLVTTAASTESSLNLTNAWFDGVENCIIDAGAGVTVPYCRGYTSDAYRYAARLLQHNVWSLGSANVYQSDAQQATMGFADQSSSDTARFKLTRLVGDTWREAASIDASGVFGTGGSGHNEAHLRLGGYHLWVDPAGALRIKQGAPGSSTDGRVIG